MRNGSILVVTNKDREFQVNLLRMYGSVFILTELLAWKSRTLVNPSSVTLGVLGTSIVLKFNHGRVVFISEQQIIIIQCIQLS